MIVLDANVLSEALKPAPSGEVLRCLAAQDPPTVFITTITQAEILCGVEALPPGKRRLRLLAAVEKMFAAEFATRILPFEESAARTFARIVANRNRAGHPISQLDAMIAAIAQSHRAGVATRNAVDFDNCGIRVVNPGAV